MDKVFYQDDHQELYANDGGAKFQLLGESQITKSASAAIGRDVVREFTPDDDHFAIHLISMGSEEDYGPNRNQDSFSRGALQKYHGNFTKYGCFYREHKNQCPETQGIGQVKYAAYNPDMHRGEIIVWGDKRKAEEEYELAKSGSELSFSMSVKMPYDRCSICDNKARSTAAYCDHLSDNLGQYIPSLEKYAYARNEDNLKFFDISRVKQPADRIAHYISFKFGEGDSMAKAASHGSGDLVISGADWAEYEGIKSASSTAIDPDAEFNLFEKGRLEELAGIEKIANNLATEGPQAYARIVEVAGAAAMSNIDSVTSQELQKMASIPVPSLLGELMKKATILPFPDFASLISGESKEDLEASQDFRTTMDVRLPNLFGNMMEGNCCCGEAAGMVSPDMVGTSFLQPEDEVEKLMDKAEEKLNMRPEPVKARSIKITIIKRAADLRSPKDLPNNKDYSTYDAMADAYGVYAVKAANYIAQQCDATPNMLDILVAQNRIPSNKGN